MLDPLHRIYLVLVNGALPPQEVVKLQGDASGVPLPWFL